VTVCVCGVCVRGMRVVSGECVVCVVSVWCARGVCGERCARSVVKVWCVGGVSGECEVCVVSAGCVGWGVCVYVWGVWGVEGGGGWCVWCVLW
jgi:hypothetical protein